MEVRVFETLETMIGTTRDPETLDRWKPTGARRTDMRSGCRSDWARLPWPRALRLRR